MAFRSYPTTLMPGRVTLLREQPFDNIAKGAGAKDLLVISGGSHSFWANQLFDENDQAMGLELGTTGITSPRSFIGAWRGGIEALR